ncbi:hypothetical protein PQQ63_22190 [Paraburkholderia metrosideri]|uniref:Uncharacterized protein n=1 Tax=Paraburkholderia metrosideri TaxID=580937 RepID=A0ABW9DWR3_9BURK
MRVASAKAHSLHRPFPAAADAQPLCIASTNCFHQLLPQKFRSRRQAPANPAYHLAAEVACNRMIDFERNEFSRVEILPLGIWRAHAALTEPSISSSRPPRKSARIAARNA